MRRRLLLCVLALLFGCKVREPRGPVLDLLARDFDMPPEARERPPNALLAAGGAGAAGWSPDPKADERDDDEETTLQKLARLAGPENPRSPTAPVINPETIEDIPPAASIVEDPVDEYEDPYKVLVIPLPVVATSPNSGLTVGGLPVVLFQESRRISTILAPRVFVNEIKGVEGVFELQRFFTRDLFLRLKTGASTEGEQDHKVQLRRRNLLDGLVTLELLGIYETDLTRRFWGIGRDTEEDDESSYVYRETSAEFELSVNLPLDLEISLRPRFERVSVGPGRIEDIPTLRQAFPGVPGSDGVSSFFVQLFGLRFDSRDSDKAPSRGVFAEAELRLARAFKGRRFAYARIDTRLTGLLPLFDERLVSVGHFGFAAVDGPDIPFYALPYVGGKTTLRGYGERRFLGDRAAHLNFEQRVNVLRQRILDVMTVLQLAAFVEFGQVWQEGEKPRLSRSKSAAGGAVRLIVPSSEIVTSIDLGVADEGIAAFVGLDYPF